MRNSKDSKNIKEDKKQLLLRLSPTLWNEISRWAEDDFRSINGQIEFILTQAIKKRKKSSKWGFLFLKDELKIFSQVLNLDLNIALTYLWKHNRILMLK